MRMTIYHVTNYERLAADHQATHDSISHDSSSWIDYGFIITCIYIMHRLKCHKSIVNDVLNAVIVIMVIDEITIYFIYDMI